MFALFQSVAIFFLVDGIVLCHEDAHWQLALFPSAAFISCGLFLPDTTVDVEILNHETLLPTAAQLSFSTFPY